MFTHTFLVGDFEIKEIRTSQSAMSNLLAALVGLQDASQSGFVTGYSQGGEAYAVWFIGPRKLHHWLLEEYAEGFFLISSASSGGHSQIPDASLAGNGSAQLSLSPVFLENSLSSVHISKTLCHESAHVEVCEDARRVKGAGAHGRGGSVRTAVTAGSESLNDWEYDLVSSSFRVSA